MFTNLELFYMKYTIMNTGRLTHFLNNHKDKEKKKETRREMLSLRGKYTRGDSHLSLSKMADPWQTHIIPRGKCQFFAIRRMP